MLQKTVLVALFLLCGRYVDSQLLDHKVITTVRHGLDASLDYIQRNLNRITVDCLLGVNFARGLLVAAYQNGTHIMDRSTLDILDKATRIIESSRGQFEDDQRNGNIWKFENLVDTNLWTKNIDYRENELIPWNRFTSEIPEVNAKFPENMLQEHTSDICLQEIINSTDSKFVRPCMVSMKCWTTFFQYGNGHGYYLTHKLLLLEVAKARKCFLDLPFYEMQVRDICSSIMGEIISFNDYGSLDGFFDLFLEQVLLCGYEGFTEFIKNDWLFYILKSQHLSGCFADNLVDSLKSRIKRDFVYFGDGCNDHTTGLGTAVLALYYNYLINVEFQE